MKISVLKFLVLGLIIVFLSSPGLANTGQNSSSDPISDTTSDKGIEDILDAFEEDTEPLEDSSEPRDMPEKTSWIDFKSYIETGVTYNYAQDPPLDGQNDWRGLSSLYNKFFSQAKINLPRTFQGVVSVNAFYDAAFAINNKDNYSKEVLDVYEKEFELWEAYIQGSLFKHVDIKLGRQIVAWGTSDLLRVTDILNPLDLREPGLVDLDSLRLPLTMSRMDYYFGDFSLTGIAIHEQRFNKSPCFGSDFYPLDMPLPHEEKIGTDLDNTELAMSLKGVFESWDISLYFAKMFNDRAHMETQLTLPGPVMTHAEVKMVGMAGQMTHGNWLLKSEIARFDGLRFFNSPGNTFSRWDLLLGVEYFGFKETHISIEAVNRHIQGSQSSLETFPDYALTDDFQAVLKISKDFFNETLNLTFLGSVLGLHAQNGSFQRLTLEYSITDDWSFLGGIINYQSGDKIEMRKIGNSDRTFLKLKYNF